MIRLEATLPVRAAQLVEAMECAVMNGMPFEWSYFQIHREECGVRTPVSGTTNFVPTMRVSNC